MEEMSWGQFKKIVKKARGAQSELSTRRFNHSVRIHVKIDNGIYAVNPYSIDLRSGYCHLAENLMTGKYAHDICLINIF